jgi:archaeosine synthase alpha-subunit
VPRIVDRLEGLSLVGRATIGAIPVSPPDLLETPAPELPPSALLLSQRKGPSGVRQLVLSRSGVETELRVPVLAPEIISAGSGVHAIAESAFLFHYPFAPDEAKALRSQRPALVVLGNARALWDDGEPFVAAVRAVRASVGPVPLLWTPRVALPHRIPFLVYLGVDLLDTTEGALRAARGDYLDATLGTTSRESALAEHACDCPACKLDPPGPLAGHTVVAYRRALAEARAAARDGRLRELVEARLVAEPALAEMLRYTDRELGPLLEERTPVTSDASRTYVHAEAQRRPEIARFRRHLLARYRPPPSKSVLLLVPCSKTKPYRQSRSHRRFYRALEGVRALERVHFVSVSSPLGLVPRELEDVYPARHYDIPVTGDWSEPERTTVVAGLDHLRRTGQYRSVVVHLDPSEYAFVRERLPPGDGVRWTLVDDRTTSQEALTALRAAVVQALTDLPPVAGGPLATVREELKEVASVQFGRSAAERLFAPPLRLSGRPWFQRLTDGHSDLATVREERGLFHLTVAGARRLGPPYPLAVEIDPALPLTGDLFAPGVRSADSEIRVGDSVVLLRSGELAGVGEAALPGPLMTELEHGPAVWVRHREHRPTDRPMTESGSPHDEGPVV